MEHEHEPLDPVLRAYVDAFIEEASVSDAQTEAALVHLEKQIESSTASEPSSNDGIGSVAKIGAAVLVAGAVGALLWSRPSPTPPTSTTQSVAHEQAPQEETASVPESTRETAPPQEDDSTVQSVPAPADPDEPASAEPSEPDHRARQLDKRRPTFPTAEVKPPVDVADDLAAELELMRAARSALRVGKTDRALSLLRRHASDYPQSAFAEERQATLIRALCMGGDRSGAEAAAKRFRDTFPSSAFAAGLLEACT
jgi:TolA-binding protein